MSWQRPRFETVELGDEERFVAMAGSATPRDFPIVVCGGPAGSWPYYLFGGGPMGLVTRKIGAPQ